MAKKPKSRAKSSHGGSRPGSGRKTLTATEIRARIVAETEKEICRNLPRLIKNMIYLANGGFERVEEKWVPAETKTQKIDGREIELTSEATLIERKVSWAAPDRAANQYLIDRILGRPTERQEVENKTETTHIFISQLSAALDISYGDESDSLNAPVPANGTGNGQHV